MPIVPLKVLNYNGILATQVYSTLDYAARKINVAKFVSKKVEVLVVTDVAVSLYM